MTASRGGLDACDRGVRGMLGWSAERSLAFAAGDYTLAVFHGTLFAAGLRADIGERAAALLPRKLGARPPSWRERPAAAGA